MLRRLVHASVAAVVCATPALAATAGQIGDPRLSGFWNIDEAQRRESTRAAKAELTPAAQETSRREAEAAAARTAAGNVVPITSGTCGVLGVPFVINTSEPWLLVVTPNKVTQIFERYLMTPRHYYTDGRSLPDVSKMPPSSSGYSVARWEGKSLVIQTRGLPPGGVQGGGLKTPQTLLTETVRVSDAGDRLTWTYRWEDPAIYVQPLVYSIEYTRAPPHTYALTQYCDPNDEPGLVAESPSQDLVVPQ